MKYKDVKIGMKVVPHNKSIGMTLNDSNVIKRAKEINRPFLYVVWFYGDKIVLSEKHEYDGSEDIEDLFLPEDFEPYINESEVKTKEEFKEGDKVKYVAVDGTDLCGKYGTVTEISKSGIIVKFDFDGLLHFVYRGRLVKISYEKLTTKEVKQLKDYTNYELIEYLKELVDEISKRIK